MGGLADSIDGFLKQGKDQTLSQWVDDLIASGKSTVDALNEGSIDASSFSSIQGQISSFNGIINLNDSVASSAVALQKFENASLEDISEITQINELVKNYNAKLLEALARIEMLKNSNLKFSKGFFEKYINEVTNEINAIYRIIKRIHEELIDEINPGFFGKLFGGKLTEDRKNTLIDLELNILEAVSNGNKAINNLSELTDETIKENSNSKLFNLYIKIYELVEIGKATAKEAESEAADLLLKGSVDIAKEKGKKLLKDLGIEL